MFLNYSHKLPTSLSLSRLQIVLLGLNRPTGVCLEQSITGDIGGTTVGSKGSPENHRSHQGNNSPAGDGTELPGAACISAGAGILQGHRNTNVKIRAGGLPAALAVLSFPPEQISTSLLLVQCFAIPRRDGLAEGGSYCKAEDKVLSPGCGEKTFKYMHVLV